MFIQKATLVLIGFLNGLPILKGITIVKYCTDAIK